jgi:hypothetical protein
VEKIVGLLSQRICESYSHLKPSSYPSVAKQLLAVDVSVGEDESKFAVTAALQILSPCHNFDEGVTLDKTQAFQ